MLGTAIKSLPHRGEQMLTIRWTEAAMLQDTFYSFQMRY
jgi:hypothetical protein